MKKGNLKGELEELVLLVVASLKRDAYGLSIKREIEEQGRRKVRISGVHAACNRLEDRGYLSSELVSRSKNRGGKRKKVYAITLKGQYVLRETIDIQQKFGPGPTPGLFHIKLSY